LELATLKLLQNPACERSRASLAGEKKGLFAMEQTLSLKEFADYIGLLYHSARRRLIEWGGYRNAGTNPHYETRRVPISLADEIKAAITVKRKKNGGGQ
jgi:hypothetical protein